MRNGRTRSAALALAAACLGACGASTTGADNSPNVVVEPQDAQVAPLGTVSFSATVTGTADTTVIWSVQEGTPGGSITSAGLYTAPAALGTFHVVAAARADPAIRGTAAVNVVTAPALAVATAALPDGAVGSAYSPTLTATGGTTPYAWAVTAGSLPAGLTLAASTGVVSGTPTAVGGSSFTVEVTDSAGDGPKSFSPEAVRVHMARLLSGPRLAAR